MRDRLLDDDATAFQGEVDDAPPLRAPVDVCRCDAVCDDLAGGGRDELVPVGLHDGRGKLG